MRGRESSLISRTLGSQYHRRHVDVSKRPCLSPTPSRRILILPPCITRYQAISSPIWQDTSREPIHVELSALRFVKPRRLRPSRHPCAQGCVQPGSYSPGYRVWITSRRVGSRYALDTDRRLAPPNPCHVGSFSLSLPLQSALRPYTPATLPACLPTVPYPPSLGLHSNHAQRAQLESSSRNRTSAAPI